MSVEKVLQRKEEPGLSIDLLPGALYPRTLMRLVHPLTRAEPITPPTCPEKPLTRASPRHWLEICRQEESKAVCTEQEHNSCGCRGPSFPLGESLCAVGLKENGQGEKKKGTTDRLLSVQIVPASKPVARVKFLHPS